MGDIAAFQADGRRRHSWRLRAAMPCVLAAVLLTACSPEYDWRDIRAPGGEYRVHLPGNPSTMTRQIHLEGFPVDMTMQGARVKENSFTVASVPLPGQPAEVVAAGITPEGILLAMRAQMLRNVGAPPATPSQDVKVDLVDVDGQKIGAVAVQAVSAKGIDSHAEMALHARFVLWRGNALQMVAVGPDLDREQTSHFFDSLRLVRR